MLPVFLGLKIEASSIVSSEAAQRKRKWPFDSLSQNTGYDHKTMKREEQRTEQMMKLQKVTDGLKDIKEGV